MKVLIWAFLGTFSKIKDMDSISQGVVEVGGGGQVFEKNKFLREVSGWSVEGLSTPKDPLTPHRSTIIEPNKIRKKIAPLKTVDDP